jgi:ferredoxin
MARSLWLINFLKKHFSMRFAVAELTKWPLIGPVMEHALFNGHKSGDTLFYLPKDKVVINQQIKEQQNTVVPSEVVSHFIDEASHVFLMDHCVCREAADCQEYDHDIGCIFLGEGVLDINPKLGRIVDKATAQAHLEKAREAGLVHLIGRDKIDAVWMGVEASTKLMTICNCCPCCCLFKFLPNLAPKLQSKIERMPGVDVRVVAEDCIGCGRCADEDICFIHSIKLVDGKAVISEDCRGCGRCVEVCTQDAIRLEVERESYVDTAIERLSQAVDVR